jgi:DNA repair exonuclease SbcCD ATPase subunit
MAPQNDTTILEHRLTNLEYEVEGYDAMKQDIQDIKGQLNQVVEALLGNPLSKSEGLSAEFRRVKSMVKDHEEIVKKVKWSWWWIVSICSVITLIIQLILKFLAP